MPSSVVRSFTDLDGYAAVIYPSSVELTIIRRGHFAASHTPIDLHRLWVRSASENLPRIANAQQVRGRHNHRAVRRASPIAVGGRRPSGMLMRP
jgi:hypothetical protein